MTTRAEQARRFNEGIAQGMSEAQALRYAGISNEGDFTYGTNGQLEPVVLGPGRRANETIVPAGANIDDGDDDDDERQFVTRPVSNQTTTTNQNTVTGGAVRTTTVTPTTYRDTAQSSALKSEADALAAQKEARAAELRAQGKTGAEVLRDPQYRALSQEAQAKENAAQDARAVDRAGAVTTTVSPGAGSEFEQTPNTSYLTNDTSGDDPNANLQDANRFSTSGELPENLEPGSADADPQANGFVFNEDGELVPADSAQAEAIRAAQDRPTALEPAPVGGNFTEVYNVETGKFDVVNLDTGEVIASGLTEQEAIIAAQDASTGGTGYPPGTGADTADPGLTPDQVAAQQQQATLDNARKQSALQAQRKQGNDTDWRFRISLAPLSTYLYNAVDESGQPAAGILEPLRKTNGVIFPYTPTITTSYQATYDSYNLTHSNYRGFFYQGSSVADIQITATFTAQDTAEAEYLLAAIHFFRSATKMFYGANDAFAGAPPPLVYCRGFGEFQFNLHPCVIGTFNYVLPNDVDYIRARSKNINGTSLLQRRDRASLPTNAVSGALARLSAAGVPKGAIPAPPSPPSLGLADATYVPTKVDLTLVLHPIQSREQVSKQFNMKQFANGDLLKGGFW